VDRIILGAGRRTTAADGIAHRGQVALGPCRPEGVAKRWAGMIERWCGNDQCGNDSNARNFCHLALSTPGRRPQPRCIRCSAILLFKHVSNRSASALHASALVRNFSGEQLRRSCTRGRAKRAPVRGGCCSYLPAVTCSLACDQPAGTCSRARALHLASPTCSRGDPDSVKTLEVSCCSTLWHLVAQTASDCRHGSRATRVALGWR
jgi:hypothetical protein